MDRLTTSIGLVSLLVDGGTGDQSAGAFGPGATTPTGAGTNRIVFFVSIKVTGESGTKKKTKKNKPTNNSSTLRRWHVPIGSRTDQSAEPFSETTPTTASMEHQTNLNTIDILRK